MPTEKYRAAVSLDPATFARLGIDVSLDENQSAHVVNGRLIRFAWLIEEAAAQLAPVLNRQEWNLLADALNGCADLNDYIGSPIPALTLLAAEAEDAHRLNRLGDKWLLTEKEQEKLRMTAARQKADERMGDLLRKLSALTPLQGEAILAAVRWFWQHTDIDHTKEEWWTPEYRASAVAK